MKKYFYLIIIVLISSLVLTGCLLSNVGQVPVTGQSGIAYLTKGPSPDLVGLWHFDGDALDSSGNGLDGSLSLSGASFVVDGFGQALNVDGAGWVQVPDSSLLEPSEITVEAWVKRLGSPGGAKYIVSKYLPNKYGSYSSYGLYTGSGGIRFYIGYTSSWIGSPQASAAAVWDGSWHHVAGTFDGSNIKLYLDGIPVDVATSTIQDIYYFGTGNLYIGAYTNSSYLAFSGTIDEVRIWKVALTVEQLGDITPPEITMIGTSPVTVEVGFTYTDEGATAEDDVDGDITVNIVTVNLVNTAVLGTYTVTYDVSDAAGNPATQVTRTVNVVDTTLPLITLNGITPVTVEVGSVYTDDGATATDNYDGDLTASIIVGELPVDTSVIGTHIITYDVTDSSYNHAIQVTRTVYVIYHWTGFFPPVDNPLVVNGVKAGSAIPVKFSLSGYQGMDIFAEGYPNSVRIECGTATQLDNIEVTVNAGGSSLNYDAIAQQYIYVWKTNKAWSGTCRQLEVKLDDGTSHLANFTFTK